MDSKSIPTVGLTSIPEGFTGTGPVSNNVQLISTRGSHLQQMEDSADTSVGMICEPSECSSGIHLGAFDPQEPPEKLQDALLVSDPMPSGQKPQQPRGAFTDPVEHPRE